MQEALSPDVAVSEYLRNNSDWKGSSCSMFYNEDGSLAGSFVTIHIQDRHRLRMMLTYLGVPKEMINRSTGFE
jgi:hypothetical protein